MEVYEQRMKDGGIRTENERWTYKEEQEMKDGGIKNREGRKDVLFNDTLNT